MVIRPLVAVITLGLSASLSGCGFTPLYAVDGPTAVATQLDAVHLADLTGPASVSRHFQNALREGISGSQGLNARYQMTVKLKAQRRAIAVTVSANTRRFDLYLFGNYTLTDTKTGVKRTKALDSVVSYGVVESQYASLVGREDAEKRAAKELARKMELDIALFLKGRAPKSETVLLPTVFGDDLIENGLPDEETETEE